MAVIQVTGGSAVTATSTNNRTGRFKGARDASVTSNLINGLAAPRQSKILGNVLADNGWMDKAISAGTFAYLVKNKYVIRRVSTTLAGVANTVLRSGSSQHKNRKSIHKVESNRTNRVATEIRAGNYSHYSGTFSVTPTVAVDSFGTDDAATPTRAIPGELTYRNGKPAVVNADYKQKNN